ncbi:MAG: alpha/beta hydrolase [Proteobacteria bacterium]|nr:alpha/beta hydrolase [Pseudomonadota bacterium]MBU1739606.1 alpha/beta hydrolase [Pseudomonadota bacterium]
MASKLFSWILILNILLTSGCTIFQSKTELAGSLAEQGNLVPVIFQTELFAIRGFQRFTDPSSPLVVYLEGDGAAWRNKRSPAADPTPRNPLALKLVIRDPAANVLYLARPCQYISGSQCRPEYWSSHRYGTAVSRAINQALDQGRVISGSSRIVLIGYSGGGTLAALVSGQREDVCRLITIAANLDVSGWTAFHRVDPLWGSDTPMRHAGTLQHVPQIHLVGSEDTIVPEAIVQSYLDALPDQSGSRLLVIADTDHHAGWVEKWPLILEELRGCP